MQRLSLIATGTPANGPTVSPSEISLSVSLAAALASLIVTKLKA